MEKVMAWLNEESKGIGAFLGYAALAALLVVSLQQIVEGALINWKILPEPTGKIVSPFEYFSLLSVAEILVIGPIMEELWFRILPLTILIAFVSKKPGFVFGAVIVFALLFGAIHPYGLHQRINIAIGGIFFGLNFLKCGGLQKKFIKAGMAAITAHSLTNLFVLLYAWWEYLVVHS